MQAALPKAVRNVESCLSRGYGPDRSEIISKERNRCREATKPHIDLQKTKHTKNVIFLIMEDVRK